MIARETKPGSRVTMRAGWGFWTNARMTFARLDADASGTLEVYDRPSRVYVKLDDGRRVETDARALELQ